MRLKSPPIFIFSIILLVGLLASTISHAQKKFSLPKIPKIHFGLPHFKNPFVKDSTNKSFNNKRWFNYHKEAPYSKNENAMPIAVGYTDFDENIRDLHLLGKLPTDNSLTIRPYILPKSVTYDSLLKAIDPSLKNKGHLVHKKHFDLQLLPFNYLQKFNSHHPYGWNDGPLSFSKGYQYLASGGVYMHWRNIHLTLRPEYFHTASDKYETSPEWGQVNPSLNKLILGQSNLRIDLGPIGIGGGANNLWLGPGYYSSLIMSNNAEGFGHVELSTNRPIKTPIGNFELMLMGASLTQNANQGYENKILYRENISSQSRYINILNLTYTPAFFKNLYLGFNRVFHTFTPKNSTNLKQDYLLVLNSLFRNQYRDDNSPIDQLLTVYSKFIFPKNYAEIYFEYGLNDGSSNLRELLTDLSHSSASILGIRKIQQINSKNYLIISAEATRMSQTPSYLLRNAGNWYEHGRLGQGYTNENQIMGAGSGFGNNVQTINFKYGSFINNIAIQFQHIEQNPRRLVGSIGNAWLGDIYWDDYTYGIKAQIKYKRIFFRINTEWVNSTNYLWQNGNNKNNFYLFLNTVYIW
jgi:hypothetical protein